MPLHDGQVYRVPDKKVYRAKQESQSTERHWTLIPLHLEQIQAKSWRDAINDLLFLDAGKVYRIDVSSLPVVKDTGWTAKDCAAIPN